MRHLFFPVVAVLAAFLVGGLFVLAIGDSPIETYRLLIGSALWWPDGIGYTLFLATPLIFTGLAVAVAFQAGLLNIGAEGQLYVAAFAAAWMGITLAKLPSVLLVPLCMMAAVAAGAFWAAIPGVLKARFGSHEVINTIMMNFIAVALVSYFTQYHYRTPGDPIMETAPIGANAHIPRLGRFIPGFPERIPVNVAFLLALAACGAVYFFLWRTKWGYELRATGSNPSAAEYGGISVRKQIVVAMAISGGLAGLCGHQRGAGLPPPVLRRVFGQLRLHGHRGGAAREQSPGGRAAGGLPVRHPLARRHPGGCVHPARDEGHRADPASDHHFVCRRRRLLPRHLQEVRVDPMRDLFTAQLFWSTIRLSTPLILAALGGMFSERSGVINIALEGMMLAGAFTAASVTYAAGNPWLGLLAGAAMGMGIASIHAVACIRYKADQVVTGTAINILMIGIPGFLSGALFLSSGSTPQIAKAHLIPWTPIVMAFAAVPISWYALYRTPFGLRLRSVGENPEAADAAGVNVAKVRYSGVLLSGVLSGIGGAYLSIGQSSLFTRNMTSGRGFIALAALIFGKWRPVQTMLACLFFGFTEAVTIQMQGVVKLPSGEDIPVQFIQMVPYVLTIIVLAGFIGHSRPPRALGRAYEKER